MSAGGEQGDVRIPRALFDEVLDMIGEGNERDERIRQAGYREGQAAAIHGYRTGYDLGHDTGLSARQDTRQYVHGVLDGWAAGCKERQELAQRLLRQMAPKRPEREREPAELEAGG